VQYIIGTVFAQYIASSVSTSQVNYLFSQSPDFIGNEEIQLKLHHINK